MRRADVEMRLALSYDPKWADQVPGAAEPYQAIRDLRKEIGDLAEEYGRVRSTPIERRALLVDRLARRGQELMKRIDERAKQRQVIEGALDELGETVRKELMTVSGAPNTNFAAAQVRDFIRTSKRGDRMKLLDQALSDPESVRAVLDAPPMASGLSLEEWQRFRTTAVRRFLPHVAEQQRILNQAGKHFDQAIKNARSMTAELAGLKQLPSGEFVPDWEV